VDPVAKILFDYLRDVIYSPAHAALDVEHLPPGFRDLGEGLKYLASCLIETKHLARALSRGDLESFSPSPGNEVAAPLKSLHASLKHLTWQTQQVAQGDYRQRVEFMGNFSAAFNAMVQQLEERRRRDADMAFKLRQYVNLLLANCPDLVLLFDVEGRAVFTSASYLICSGIEDSDSIRDKSFRDLFAAVAHEAFLQQMEELLQSAVSDKLSSQAEQQLALGNDGNARHYRIQLTPMLDELGDVVGTMIVFHDMTESIRARHAAERARDLAEQATRAKSEFLARMSHEMRTPMNAIIGMTTAAQASDDPERKAHCLARISDASQHMLGVISDILDMSGIEAGSFELSLGECGVTDMVRRVAGGLTFGIEERQQRLLIDLDENMPERIISDERRLAQVLGILLSNAVKFTPHGGVISLSAKKTAAHGGSCMLRFVIKDTGIGISEEQQKELFAAFTQADGSFSRKFGGTGLGLSIARHIVALMDGRIWVESELGKGAAFLFEIKAKLSVPQKTETDDNGDAMVSGRDIFAGKNILVAEDIDINREVIASLLEHTGAELVFAHDGAEVVEKFCTAPEFYNAILMDIHMPEVDGYEATRRIRASGLPGADAVPIIAVTANVFREDIRRCLAVGMNSHLGKPIDAGMLVAELKKHLV